MSQHLRAISAVAVLFVSIQAHAVRVKMLTLKFPVSISGVGVTIKGIKKQDIQNVSIPREKSITLNFKKISRQPTWFITENEKVDRNSLKYIEITSTSDDVLISGYKIPTPVLITPQGDVISALPLDTYLEGVLAGEMPSSWPMEALKAQVVAARSYTLYQIENRKDQIFQLEGGVLDQVFLTPETSAQKNRIRQALKETEGLVLTEKGHVLKAYYHSDCGGQTEDPDQIWGGGPKKKSILSVTDDYCAFSPNNKWSLEISLSELQEKLDSSGKALNSVSTIRVVTRTPSGRAALVALSDSASDKHILISGNELRKILGFNKLKSTLFTIKSKEDSIVFTGRGFGHGGGLCQWGAKYMASHGAHAKEILKHYYPTASFFDVDVANR